MGAGFKPGLSDLALRSSKLCLRNIPGERKQNSGGLAALISILREEAAVREEEDVQREAGRTPREGEPWWPENLALSLSPEAPRCPCPANHAPVSASWETTRQQSFFIPELVELYSVSGNPKAPTYPYFGMLPTVPLVSKLFFFF